MIGDPSVQPPDVDEQVGDLPVGTRRHRRRRCPAARAAPSSASPSRRIASKYSRVLASGDGYRRGRASSGPLLSALFTSVDTVHASSSSSGTGTSSCDSAAVSLVRRRRATCPMTPRGARPASGRGSARQLVGVGRDDRARPRRAARRRRRRGRARSPTAPRTRAAHRRAGGRTTAASASVPSICLPLVEAVGGNDAPALPNARLNAALGRDLLAPRVDQPVADRGVLGPRRHQTPAHHVEHPLTLALGDHRHVGPGRDVVAGLVPSGGRTSSTSKRSASSVGDETVT